MQSIILRLFVLVGLLVLPQRLLRAQTIDPSFRVAEVYQPGDVQHLIRQPDGKLLVLGWFTRAARQSVQGLARLSADGQQLDVVFQQNTQGLIGGVKLMQLLPSGKILLSANDYSATAVPFSLGGVTRRGLMLLNADGTPDASFDAGLGPNWYVHNVLGQPDGKILLTGAFNHFNGLPVGYVIRLNANGSLDTTFQANAPTVLKIGRSMVLQPDGKILVGGSTSTNVFQVSTLPLVRLLPNGHTDNTFNAASNVREVMCLALQPDGKVLISESYSSIGCVRRLLSNGSLDPAFQLPTGWGSTAYSGYDSFANFSSTLVQVEAGTGRILLITPPYLQYNGQQLGGVARLLPNGSPDPTFSISWPSSSITGSYTTEMNHRPRAIVLLPNGTYLVAGRKSHYGTPTINGPQTPIARLDATGNRDYGFRAVLQVPGRLEDAALQADGKIIVGGWFSEINGREASNLARLTSDGEVDTAYTANYQVDYRLQALLLQPDGKLLIGGQFLSIGGLSRPSLARLLPNGQPDVTFNSHLNAGSEVEQLGLFASGQIMVRGTNLSGALWPHFALNRISSTGIPDASFFPQHGGVAHGMLTLPNGKILLGGQFAGLSGQATPVLRLSASGSIDPTFQQQLETSRVAQFESFGLDASGRIYVGGSFDKYGAVNTQGLARMLPDGQPDSTFIAAPVNFRWVHTLTVQPNQRVLLGGSWEAAGGGTPMATERLLSTGRADSAYNATFGPDYSVNRWLVQPDGRLLAVGSFTSVRGGLPVMGLVRFLDSSNVLSTNSRSSTAPITVAYPNPVHGQLYLTLDAAARPQRVALLNALGQTVLAQPATQPKLTLNTAGLAPGLYLLRVNYASGAVVRRVVVE